MTSYVGASQKQEVFIELLSFIVLVFVELTSSPVSLRWDWVAQMLLGDVFTLCLSALPCGVRGIWWRRIIVLVLVELTSSPVSLRWDWVAQMLLGDVFAFCLSALPCGVRGI